MTTPELPDRLIRVEGTYNLRDVGGYRADGGKVNWGRLYRSDALHRLTPRAHEALEDLGVSRVIDLRDAAEIRHQPDLLPRSIAYAHVPIFPSASNSVRQGLGVEGLTELIYLQHADTLTAALTHISHDESPTIVHCTAGKDRTGAVIALTLASLGVDRDDILHDYAATERYLRGEWLDAHLAELERFGFTITEDVRSLVGSSPIPAIEHALKLVEREHGSVRDYLITHGLSEATIERLHRNLVA